MKYLPQNTEWEVDRLIARWIQDLDKLNTDQKIDRVNPVLINIFKAITRGYYTPEQLKRDLEAYMDKEAFLGWEWTKDNERFYEIHSATYLKLVTKEREHNFI